MVNDDDQDMLHYTQVLTKIFNYFRTCSSSWLTSYVTKCLKAWTLSHRWSLAVVVDNVSQNNRRAVAPRIVTAKITYILINGFP